MADNKLNEKTMKMPTASFYRMYDSMASKPQIYKTVNSESKIAPSPPKAFKSPEIKQFKKLVITFKSPEI